MKDKETVHETRLRLFKMVESYQGFAFVSDDETEVNSWAELEEHCEYSARMFQAAANVCRAIARTARKRQDNE